LKKSECLFVTVTAKHSVVSSLGLQPWTPLGDFHPQILNLPTPGKMTWVRVGKGMTWVDRQPNNW